MSAVPVVLVTVLALVAGLVAAAVLARPVRAVDVAWLAGDAYPSADEAAVYERYLRRHRRHRAVGGLFGAAFAVVTGVAWYGSVHAGIGTGSPFADVLWCALAGIVCGALSAETFRFDRPRRPSARTAASLEPHAPAARADLARVARVLVVCSLMVAGVVVAVRGLGSLGVLTTAVAGAAMVGVAEVTRASIAGRRRPVMTDAAARVDARIRAFAGVAVARLELAAAVLTAGWVVSGLPDQGGGGDDAVRVVLVLAALVATLVLLHRAAPRAPRGWLPPGALA
ncbi:hypothetical protein [Cellulomonas alba]|uniref:Uncharacterized protein n=1 Tax=Cellulomonas alba TaxID=3053467 RepID=A0ABT7SIX3_9CELL|nr:hypothetical protein [Cellulomonas alba]MDM7856135.1 hypothetical protein [Cellulomonas alba]